MAFGIITENWMARPGPGDIPRWTVTGFARYHNDTIKDLERNAARIKFSVVPNRRALTALAIDGVEIYTVAIKPTGYGRITDCVKLSPVTWERVAPEQQQGPHLGYGIIRYRVQYQQLYFNHI